MNWSSGLSERQSSGLAYPSARNYLGFRIRHLVLKRSVKTSLQTWSISVR